MTDDAPDDVAAQESDQEAPLRLITAAVSLGDGTVEFLSPGESTERTAQASLSTVRNALAVLRTERADLAARIRDLVAQEETLAQVVGVFERRRRAPAPPAEDGE